MRSQKPRRRRSFYRRKKAQGLSCPDKGRLSGRDSQAARERALAVAEDAIKRAEDIRWLKSIAEQIRAFEQAGRFWENMDSATVVGPIDAAIQHGAFGDPGYAQLHAMINPGRTLPGGRFPMNELPGVLSVTLRFLCDKFGRPSPKFPYSKEGIQIIAVAIESEINRLQAQDADDWITKSVAADIAGCSDKTISNRVKDGTLRSNPDGHVRRSEVMFKLDSGKLLKCVHNRGHKKKKK